MLPVPRLGVEHADDLVVGKIHHAEGGEGNLQFVGHGDVLAAADDTGERDHRLPVQLHHEEMAQRECRGEAIGVGVVMHDDDDFPPAPHPIEQGIGKPPGFLQAVGECRSHTAC